MTPNIANARAEDQYLWHLNEEVLSMTTVVQAASGFIVVISGESKRNLTATEMFSVRGELPAPCEFMLEGVGRILNNARDPVVWWLNGRMRLSVAEIHDVFPKLAFPH